jgi:hypothetical protein
LLVRQWILRTFEGFQFFLGSGGTSFKSCRDLVVSHVVDQMSGKYSSSENDD